MRGLLTLVIAMGVLIVAGVAFLGLTIVRRVSAPVAMAAAVLAEPAGTRMISIAGAGDRFAVLLQGGGADRIVFIDARSGLVAGQVVLGGVQP